MHIDNREELLMVESILKTINSIKSANYLLNKFLSASALSSLTLRLLQKALPDDHSLSVVHSHLQENQIPNTIRTFPFQNLSSILLYTSGYPTLHL